MQKKQKNNLRPSQGAKKLWAQLRRGLMTLVVMASTTMVSFATETATGGATGGAFGGSKFATGTIRLINDLTALITILGPIVGGLAAGVFLLRRSMADEQDGKMWTKRAITAVCCGISVGLVAGIITIITGYYE